MYLKLMHKFLLILSTLVLLNAEETFMVDDFEATLFSKASGTLQVQGSFIFEGRDVDIYDFKIIDALNVVIGSFYAEDLLTSKGKEAFKTTLIKYVQEKYALDIDTLYISF